MGWKTVLTLACLGLVLLVSLYGQEAKAERSLRVRRSYKSRCRLAHVNKKLSYLIWIHYQWRRCYAYVPAYKCIGRCQRRRGYGKYYGKHYGHYPRQCCKAVRHTKVHFYVKFKCGYYPHKRSVYLRQPTACKCSYCY